MDDFLFSIEIVAKKVLEDFRHYYPEGYKKTKPMVHWGVEYGIKFMDEDIPEEKGMVLSRRFMEITLRANEEPTPALIARELIMRGGHSVGAASMKARESWWNGHKPEKKRELTAQEEVELMAKTDYIPADEDENGQQTLSGLEDEAEDQASLQVKTAKAGQSKGKSGSRVRRKSH
jgi:hypothetical protein